MGDWIQRIAEDKNREAEETLLRQRLQLHRSKVIEANGFGMFDELRLRIERDIQAYYQFVPGAHATEIRSDRIGLDRVRITKNSYPTVTLDVSFNPTAPSIDADYTRTAEFGGEEQLSKLRLRFEIDDKDHLYLSLDGKKFFKVGEVSELLLRQVLAA